MNRLPLLSGKNNSIHSVRWSVKIPRTRTPPPDQNTRTPLPEQQNRVVRILLECFLVSVCGWIYFETPLIQSFWVFFSKRKNSQNGSRLILSDVVKTIVGSIGTPSPLPPPTQPPSTNPQSRVTSNVFNLIFIKSSGKLTKYFVRNLGPVTVQWVYVLRATLTPLLPVLLFSGVIPFWVHQWLWIKLVQWTIDTYRPQTKLRKGNVSRMLSMGGRGYLPDTPWHHTPPFPWADTSQDRHPPDRYIPW